MSELAKHLFSGTARELVVHLKRDEYDVRVDRQTKWGNPKPLSDFPGRLECLRAYLEWLTARPTDPYDPQQYEKYEQREVFKDVSELEGQVLGCWCAPKLCHGMVLAELANTEGDPEELAWSLLEDVNKSVEQRPEQGDLI